MSGWGRVPSVRGMYRDQDRHSPAAMLDRAVAGHASLPCRVFDPDLWFADTQADLDAAKRLCATCPIRLDCLEAAVARAEPWGVWGGEIIAGGAVIPHKPRRGRPRRANPLPAACVA
jgi:WhiB family redox-sensing transcriptional regulator